MFKAITFFLMKTTGLLPEWIFFKRKTYFENRTNQKRKLPKGGVLIVSNHRSFYDYLSTFFVFYFYKIRPVVSTAFYKNNPVLRFCLKCVGAIVVSDNMLDTSYIDETINLLKKGKKVIIYPEGHFALKDELLPFAPSYIKIAYEANVPLITMYTDGHYSLFKRNHMMIGQRYHVHEMVGSILTKDKINELNDYFVKNIGELRRKTLIRIKNPLLRFKDLPMDLGRIVAYLHFGPIFRVHTHDQAKIQKYHQIDGPFIIASNHVSFSDPLVLMCAFFRRRLHILMAEEVHENRRLRKSLLKGIGGIYINRHIFDINAINECCDTLGRGRAILIFPEGHITRDGTSDNFKDGVGMIASRSNVPVLPIYIVRRNKWIKTHHIFTGELIYPTSSSMKSVKELSKIIEERINDLKIKANSEGYIDE